MSTHTGGWRGAPAARRLWAVAGGVVLALWGAAPGALAFQKKPKEDPLPEVDPYTQGKGELMEALGYRSFGPFFWADGHSSTDIEALLGGIPFVWVETAHFKIGSNLPPYTLATDKIEKNRIRDELKRLKKTLRRIKPSTRHLDRWLRLHLYAQRMEDLYADFSDRFCVTDADFPSGPDAEFTEPYMGYGPFLGQPGKFLVLLLDSQSSYARYTERYLGGRAAYPTQYRFQSGSLFYGTCTGFLTGPYDNDSALYCDVMSGAVQIFLNAFRGYDHSVPMWWRLGVASWYTRNLDERYNVYGIYQSDREKAYRWQPRVRARVKNEFRPSAAKVLGWTDPEKLQEADHMMIWSRTDFLLSRGKEPAGKFLMALKEPLPLEADKTVEEQIQEVQIRALEDCFGLTLEEFDEQWERFVLKTYDSR